MLAALVAPDYAQGAMYSRLILSALTGCTAVLTGCAAESATDDQGRAGGDPFAQDSAAAATVGTRKLELLSERRVGLAFGGQTLLRVALTRADDGAPVKGSHVSFAFQGVARDASLDSLDAATDAGGIAENTLTVGEFVGTFNVEISAPGAVPVTVQVSVGNAGFGTVIVRAPYTGERQVQRRRIAIVAEAACADAEPGAGDHVELLSQPGNEAVFLLPAETDYAVVAFAHGLGDTVLARGCTLAEEVEADVETTVEVVFLDQTLESTGDFELEAELSSSEPAATLAAIIEQAAVAYVETDRNQVRNAEGADARLLLDALEDLLRTEAYLALGGDALADDIVAERSVPSLDPALDVELQTTLDGAMSAAGARLAAARLAQDTADNLSTVTLLAKLTIDSDDEAAPLSWMPLSVDAGVLQSGEDGPVIDLSPQGLAEVSATLLAADDSIDVQQARFELPWGTLASEVLVATNAYQVAADPSTARARFGCDVFADWVANTPLIAGGCDDTCAREACGVALGDTVDAAAAALIAVDEARPTVTMWGRLSLHDDTGDLAVERMDVEQLRGEWDDAPGPEPERLEGTASGQVLLNLIER